MSPGQNMIHPWILQYLFDPPFLQYNRPSIIYDRIPVFAIRRIYLPAGISEKLNSYSYILNSACYEEIILIHKEKSKGLKHREIILFPKIFKTVYSIPKKVSLIVDFI